MNYYWMYYNTTLGDLAPQHSTHSPYVPTTGADGTTSQTFDTSLIPSGNAVLGPYDDSVNNNMPSDFQTAYNNPQAWLYQNGAYVSNPNYASFQLVQAKQAQYAYLDSSFAKSIASGFPSSASGTSDTYAIDPVSMGKWTGTLANINAGNVTTNIIVKDITGKKVTLTPTQFKTFALDGFNYYNTQEQNLWTKEADVEAATTVSDVQAVTW